MNEINPEDFKPGSFGCHEALHTAHVIIDMIDGHLINHPAIEADEEFLRLANTAQEALCDLYQAIGRKHHDGGEG